MAMGTVILFIILFALIGVLVWKWPAINASLKTRNERREVIREKIDRALSYIETYENRLNIIGRHAADYQNSLGMNGVERIKELRGSNSLMKAVMDEVLNLNQSGSQSALAEAEKILDGLAPVPYPVKGEIQYYSIPKDWQNELENQLQELAREVAEAAGGIYKLNRDAEEGRKSTVINTLKELKSLDIYLDDLWDDLELGKH